MTETIILTVALGIWIALEVRRRIRVSRRYHKATARLIERHTPAGINRYPDEDGT